MPVFFLPNLAVGDFGGVDFMLLHSPKGGQIQEVLGSQGTAVIHLT